MLGFAVTPRKQREDRARTGETLDRVDGWIAEGVLGGEQLHCADYAVAPSLALVDDIVALRPELRRRPLCELLDRVLPG
jgi:glutathione S-transferase